MASGQEEDRSLRRGALGRFASLKRFFGNTGPSAPGGSSFARSTFGNTIPVIHFR